MSGWGCWSVGADRNPIAVFRSGKIILERIPFSLRLIEPVHVPDPLQVQRALFPHQVDDVAVCLNEPGRARLWSTVPFAVPTKPFAVRLGAPLDQDRGIESFRVLCPRPQIRIEVTRDDPTEGEC